MASGQNIFKSLTKKAIFKGSAVLTTTTVLSYALGLLRDRLFAQTFGATRVLDAYNAAFTLPDLILNIFVAGALTAAFVPIFTDLTEENKRQETNIFVNSVLNSSLIAVLVSGLLVFAFAPQLSRYIVPGFDEQSRKIFVDLTRLLLLSPIIFSISNTFVGIALTRYRFFLVGISAPLYNLGIILGTVILAAKYGIYGVAVGTIIGALLHLLPRLIGLGFSFRYRPMINFNQEFKKYVRLMLPKAAGHPVEQLTFLGFTIIASAIGAGSIAILNFARNFQSMPVNAIGVAFSLAAFPLLAKAISVNDKTTFNREFTFTLKSIALLATLAALIIYLIRRPLIAIFLGGGAFDQNAVDLTAAALGIFALSIPTESASHLLARGFYAFKDSLTPVIISLISLAVAVTGGYVFSATLGVKGLALGFVLGSLLKTASLMILLTRKSRLLQN